MVTVLRTSAAAGSPSHLDLGKSLVSHVLYTPVFTFSHVLYTRVFTSSTRAPHPQSLPHLSSGLPWVFYGKNQSILTVE